MRPDDDIGYGAEHDGHPPVLVLQHGELGPPGLLGDWLRARGMPAEVHRDGDGLPAEDPRGYAFVASLGSWRSPRDADDPVVARELDLLARAVEHDVPVLGLCFGGQALAVVLGGTVERAPVPELGWHEVETTDPDTVAAGPWLQWHFERFTVPPGGQELARSLSGSQAFRHGRHLGVQFHPESTIEIVRGWARSDRKRLAGLGIDDGEALATSGRRHAAGAAQRAFRLFDAFWSRAQG